MTKKAQRRARVQWMPIEFPMVDAMDRARLLTDAPASRLDGFAYAWVSAQRGSPLTRRQLAAWAGWSQRQASRVLQEVRDKRAAWNGTHPSDPETIQPAEPETIHTTPAIPAPCEDKRSRNDPGSIQDRSDRARGSTGTGTSTGTSDDDQKRARAREHAVRDDDLVTAEDWLLLRTGLRARRPIE